MAIGPMQPIAHVIDCGVSQGALLARIAALVLAGLPTTTTRASRFAASFKARP